MKTKLIKFISAFMCVAIMSGSLASITVLAAAESFVYNNENQSTMQFGDSSENATTGKITWEQNGKNGKQNKYGLAVTGSAGGGEFRILRSDGAWQKAETAQYMVMSAQIMPLDNSVTSVFWATQGSAALSYNSAKEAQATADKLVQNKWNTVTTVYKLDGTYYETYLNGVRQFTGKPLRNINDVTYKRIQFHVYAPTGTQFGLDNVRMYQVSDLPTISVPTINEGEKYSLSGNVISVSGGIELTVADLDFDGSTVRVYRDSSMSEVLSQSAVIGDKNVVVVENSEGDLSYYDVSVAELRADIFKFDENNKSGLASADKSLTGTFTWTENGTNGKAENDGYAVAMLGSASYGELRLQKGSWIKQNGTSYVVLSADMMIPDDSDIYRVFWGTNSSQRVAHEQTRDALIMKKLKRGVWNNYTVVFDMNSQYAYTYINGELIVENKTQSTIVGKRIQFHIFGREGNEVYLDNLYGYQTSVYPEIKTPTVLQAEDGNIKIYSNENVTVENLAMMNVNSSRVYINSTLTQISPDTVLKDGNVVVVESANGIAYYDVKEIVVNDGLNIASVPNIENGVLKSVEVMSGKDIEVENNECLVFAAYKNGVLTALQVVSAPTSVFVKNKAQNIEVNINVDNADGFSVMLVNLNTLSTPCAKADYSFAADFDKEDAIRYFYPNYKKKAVSFSIDDGDYENDPKFVKVLNQYGLKGTFNLVSDRFENYNADKLAAFLKIYDGHEVGNHVRYHAEYRPNLIENDFKTLTAVDDIEGMYYGTTTSDKINRYYATTPEAFIKAVELGKIQVETAFEGSNVKAYAYPGGNDSYYEGMEKIYDYLDKNYASVRETGQICCNDEFDAPNDMKIWNTTVYYNTIEEYGEKFINKVVDDESNLQLFTVGTHATDYVNKTDPTDNGNYMDDLERFCEKCKNNENEIWSATISEIADYLEAKKDLVITSEKITNNSDTDLYLEVKGKKVVVPAGGSYGK